MKNLTPACNAHSIFQDAVAKFLIQANHDDLLEVFMEVGLHNGAEIDKIKEVCETVLEGLADIAEGQ